MRINKIKENYKQENKKNKSEKSVKDNISSILNKSQISSSVASMGGPKKFKYAVQM